MRPLIVQHQSKFRSRDGLSNRNLYAALLCGVLCFSTWVLLNEQVSLALPAHVPFPSSPWVAGSDARASSSGSSGGSTPHRPASMLRQLVEELLPHTANASAAAAAQARGADAGGGGTLMTFARSRTAMPFLFVTCRMCNDSVAADMTARRLHAPVTSTLLESIISNTPLEDRVAVLVNAGLGYFTQLAAAWGSKIVAFEPRAWQRGILLQNAALARDGRVKVVPYGVGALTTLQQPQKQQAPAGASATNSSSSSGATASNATSASGAGNAAAGAGSGGTAPPPEGPVVTVALSDAISSDVTVSQLIIDGSCVGGLPSLQEVFAGAWEALGRVQWLFITSLCDPNSTATQQLLRDILQRGNFTHLYNYGEAADALLDQQQQQGQQLAMQPLPVQQQQEAAGIMPAAAAAAAGPVSQPQQQQQQHLDEAPAAAAAAASASGGDSYPADARFSDITGMLLLAGGPAGAAVAAAQPLKEANVIFTRQALGTMLQITMPAPLVWDFDLLASNKSTTATGQAAPASSNAGSSDGEGGSPAQAPSPDDPPEIAVEDMQQQRLPEA